MHHDREFGAGLRQCGTAQRLFLFAGEVARYADLADEADLRIRPVDTFQRLAHDLGVHVVSPLDGVRPGQLHGAQAVLILGG